MARFVVGSLSTRRWRLHRERQVRHASLSLSLSLSPRQLKLKRFNLIHIQRRRKKNGAQEASLYLATGNRLSRQAHLRPIFDMPANRFGPALLLRLKIVKKKKKKKGRHKTFPSGASPGRAVDSLHLLTKTNETQRVPRNASISHSFGKRRKKKTLRLMQSNKKAVASFFLFLALPPPDNELIRFSTRLLLRGRMDESDSTSRDCCATSARYAIITTRPCRPFSFSLSFFLLAGRFTLHNK